MEKIIYDILSADQAFINAIGANTSGKARVYPNIAPDGIVPPYSIVQMVSGTESYNKQERGVYTRFVQLDLFAQTKKKASELKDLAIATLNLFSGVQSGYNVQSIRLVAESSSYDNDADIYRQQLEFKLRINP